jgi:hypothetical protein
MRPQVRHAPAILKRNSASPVKDNVVVYWASPKGELMLAPDTRITEAQLRRMPEYKHWRRCEAVGAREIEKIGLKLSQQEFERRKRMDVERVLREMKFIQMKQVEAKLRKAQHYSANDAQINGDRVKFWQNREDRALSVIASQFDPTRRRAGLEMEFRAQSTSRSAHINQKPTGITA